MVNLKRPHTELTAWASNVVRSGDTIPIPIALADASVFSLFDRAVRPADLLEAEPAWFRDGVDWSHTRYGFRGVDHGVSLDIFSGVRPGKRGWSILGGSRGLVGRAERRPGEDDPMGATHLRQPS